jgi:hypothetical protein
MLCALPHNNPICAAARLLFATPFTLEYSLVVYQLVSYQYRTGMLAGSKGTAMAFPMREG